MSQFFYIHPDNPQVRLINQTVDILQNGGVIIYPTDSGYALGCLIDNKQGVDRIRAIRQLPENHNFTLVCNDLSEISHYARVDNKAYRLLKNNTPGGYTFILTATKELPRRLTVSKRKTIGIRVPDNVIALSLLKALKAPLLSCSLMLPKEEDITYADPEEIRDHLEYAVDLIIHGGNLGQEPTTVIDLTEDTPTLLRQGRGDTRPFF